MRASLFLFLCVTFRAFALTPDEGLQRLQAGNQRFVSETLLHPDRTQERRLSLVEGQSPFAVIITCADSRVVPEVLFDEGIGDLFVIRVAGNVIGPTERESVEYAVDHFHPVVVLVMGHEKCGAVDAVVNGQTDDIATIAGMIDPSVQEAKESSSSDLLRRSIELNALRMRSELLRSPSVKQAIQERQMAVHAAYYQMQTGIVQLLD